MDRAYNGLRAEILAGRRAPGAKLQFAEISAQYRASIGVMREALTRLQGEGLVDSEPQAGFRVISISRQALQDLTEARLAIEILVLRKSMACGDIKFESQLLATHHELDRTVERAPDERDRLTDEWVAAHASFHRVLLAGCPNTVLTALAGAMRDSAELYRQWSVPAAVLRDIKGEHRAILNAVLAHDVESAVDLLGRHIQSTTDILLVSPHY